jgi:predicted TIM-barrel fold metal-dependent hydrolase
VSGEAPPPRAVDCHAHIFATGLPLAPVRRYAPEYDCPVEAYVQTLDEHQVQYGVLVQPSFLGTDNSYLVDALRRFPDRLRGIAVVDPGTDADSLESLDRSGVVGIRLNLEGLDVPDFRSAGWADLLAWLVAHEWQVEVNRKGSDLPGLLGPLLDAGVRVVVDHFGRPAPQDDLAGGIADDGFRYLLAAAAETDRVWIKVSGVYRLGAGEQDQALATQVAAEFGERVGPHRMIWGSDWPHTQFEGRMDFATTLADLTRTLPDPAIRRQVLAANPATLFRFPTPDAA